MPRNFKRFIFGGLICSGASLCLEFYDEQSLVNFILKRLFQTIVKSLSKRQPVFLIFDDNFGHLFYIPPFAMIISQYFKRSVKQTAITFSNITEKAPKKSDSN